MIKVKIQELVVSAVEKLFDRVNDALEVLIENRIVDQSDAKTFGVKILGDGTLTHALTISLPISKSAAKKVEEAGGKVKI